MHLLEAMCRDVVVFRDSWLCDAGRMIIVEENRG